MRDKLTEHLEALNYTGWRGDCARIARALRAASAGTLGLRVIGYRDNRIRFTSLTKEELTLAVVNGVKAGYLTVHVELTHAGRLLLDSTEDGTAVYEEGESM